MKRGPQDTTTLALCDENPSVMGGFFSQWASDVEF